MCFTKLLTVGKSGWVNFEKFFKLLTICSFSVLSQLEYSKTWDLFGDVLSKLKSCCVAKCNMLAFILQGENKIPIKNKIRKKFLIRAKVGFYNAVIKFSCFLNIIKLVKYAANWLSLKVFLEFHKSNVILNIIWNFGFYQKKYFLKPICLKIYIFAKWFLKMLMFGKVRIDRIINYQILF